MTRDGGIGGVRQTELDDRAARPAWPFARRHRREKAVDDDLLDFVTRKLRGARAADQFRARAEPRDEGGLGRLRAKQLLFRGAATRTQLGEAACGRALALFVGAGAPPPARDRVAAAAA